MDSARFDGDVVEERKLFYVAVTRVKIQESINKEQLKIYALGYQELTGIIAN
ncbi:MAG: hypothetical protein HFG34_10330 [Eubacterium sp.]|nr:hypothetical protein [Eubacterium sp.]